MPDDKPETVFTDMSDEELQEFSDDLIEAIPEFLSEMMGKEIPGREEWAEEAHHRIDQFLDDFQEAMDKESEEEQLIHLFDTLGGVTSQALDQEFDELDGEYGGNPGIDPMMDYLESTIEGSREFVAELGYGYYFFNIEEFSKEVVKNGYGEEVHDFFNEVDADSQQIFAQHQFSQMPQVFETIEDVEEVSNPDEARQFAKMYHDVTEIVGLELPILLSVLQMVSGEGENYKKLRNMRLHNLLQKLNSDDFKRFNHLAQGINLGIRNSTVHKDYKIQPNEKEVVFSDRGDTVAELSYSELTQKVYQLIAVYHTISMFRTLLLYHRMKPVQQELEQVREELEEG